MIMRIVVKQPDRMPEVREVENELHVFQDIVGGYIQCVNVVDNIICVCNEEGKLIGLNPNFIFNNDMIVGSVFFCAVKDDDFDSLTDEQVKIIMSAMSVFETKVNKKLQ